MKKCILSVTLLIGCIYTITECQIPEELIGRIQNFLDDTVKATPHDTETALLQLCNLAQERTATTHFQELHEHIQKKYSPEKISAFYDTLLNVLPQDPRWDIYGAVYDAEKAERNQRSNQQPTPAQLWQKCLNTTIEALKENRDCFKTDEDFKCAIIKLINIKAREIKACQAAAQSPR